MAPPLFPKLPGQAWSVKVTPTFATRVATHASGREVRASLYARPRYQFELTFDGLDSLKLYPGLREQSLQSLMGLYLQCQGQFGTFLYQDPENHFVGNGVIGAGDGSTTSFTAQRTLGGATEPVGYVLSLANVTVDGVLVSGAVVTAPNTITLASAPSAGALVAATFQYAYLCRFLDDQVEFENFMYGLWSVGSLKFMSVR